MNLALFFLARLAKRAAAVDDAAKLEFRRQAGFLQAPAEVGILEPWGDHTEHRQGGGGDLSRDGAVVGFNLLNNNVIAFARRAVARSMSSAGTS